ncbi:MAG: NAD(P)-dependent oxidoreductase [Gammaproteobacteria bacterium]|nr:MAG: NAD(P)-dependent oxidoreductase [Gammaproteobacteria bacterium]
MNQDQPRLAFLGIGLMGLPMCRRLLAAGYPLTVWNRSPGKTDELAEAGAVVAVTPAEAAAAADIVMLSLADTAAVEEVVFDSRGVAECGEGEGKLLVDFSSIEPGATRRFAATLAARNGMSWIDAPVSGGVTGAEAGTLAIMAGGEEADIERLRPVAACLSQRLTHMGPVGSGQVAKVCNQMIVSCNVLVLAEVMALARRAGIDAGRLPEALKGGFADSIPLQLVGPMMAQDRFEPVRWHVRTLLKDLDTAVGLSRSEGSPVPLTGLAAQLMRAHGAKGNLEADPATLIRLYLE